MATQDGLRITPEQRANLEKLATHLEALPADYSHFDMGSYFKKPTDQWGSDPKDAAAHTCGSVACAIGHGPFAGIPIARDEYSWTNYAERVFGFSDANNGAGEYLFSNEWEHVDNTVAGAAARIRFVLENGCPDYWRDEIAGNAPLSYRVVQS